MSLRFFKPANGSFSESLSYNLSEGSYVLRYATSGFQAESQINVVKAAQGEITMAVNDFYAERKILLPYLEEIGAYFGMKGSTISQLSRRFEKKIKADKELKGILDKVRREGLMNVET